MSTFVQESKLVGEVYTLKVNFQSRLEMLETVETCEVGIEVLVGVDEGVADMLTGEPTVVGNTYVYQQVGGGVVGVIYQLTFAARTSDNNIYMNQCKLAVLPNPDMTVPELP